jgi:hypothetical protein
MKCSAAAATINAVHTGQSQSHKLPVILAFCASPMAAQPFRRDTLRRIGWWLVSHLATSRFTLWLHNLIENGGHTRLIINLTADEAEALAQLCTELNCLAVGPTADDTLLVGSAISKIGNALSRAGYPTDNSPPNDEAFYQTGGGPRRDKLGQYHRNLCDAHRARGRVW